ncbi:MAG: pirin family protein [Candidatus Latescibacteria bacterium]|nr:pirin family protein [Candidatus Latescibacterota bacterium]
MTTSTKQLEFTRKARPLHWVGDGFPVRPIISPQDPPQDTSPFLLLDYAEPFHFDPAETPRGVGEHPHRGFETVTIAYQGQIDHRDSAGNAGTIGPGDVQWMTAASGVVHEELHGAEFTRSGGNFEMIQLWVNLPASHKMEPPRYQELAKEQIPIVDLPGRAGTLRVVAGQVFGASGPAQTVTPINLWDIDLKAGGQTKLELPDNGSNTLLLVLSGQVQINGGDKAGQGELARFQQEGTTIALQAPEAAKLLLLNGAPIDEPVVAHGPFVMNDRAQISQAIRDYQNGQMGRLAS